MIDLALVLVNWARERLKLLEGWLLRKKYSRLDPHEPSEISKAFVKAYEVDMKNWVKQAGSRLKGKGDFR